MSYSPSQHIPLSKPMGAGAFPLDGKFMFYTNGAGGVYKYRPFQSTAEVLTYFTYAFRVGNFEILVNEGGTLSGDGGSITGGENKVYWFANGVTDEDLVLKIGGGGAQILVFNESFLQADGGGGWYLPIGLPENGIIGNYAVIVKSGITSYLPIQLDPNGTAVLGFPDNDPQTITIKII